MKVTNKPFLAKYSLILSLILVGCGGGSSDTSTTSGDQASTSNYEQDGESSTASSANDEQDESNEESSDTSSTGDEGEEKSNTVVDTTPTTLPISYTPDSGRLLGSQCAQCHGTNGVSVNGWDSIAGEDDLADEIYDDEPIMSAQAHGYTSEEITLIGNWLKTLPKND
ncbi:MAG: hypothetical protein U9N49_01920 [Campylobacterota bacterium]|nr:hypothetical protein [Campylobacterota bacterium]